MTLTANAPRNEYTATTGQTVFNYTFKIYSDQDLNVYITPSGQAADDATDITTDYVIDAGTIGAEGGGFLTMNTGVTAGYKVTIVSAISEDRTTDYQNNGDFIPDTVNNDLDRAVSLVKQAIDAAGRTIGFQESAQNVSALGFEEPQADAFLAWSSDGTKVINASGASIPGLSDAVTQAEAAEANAAASAGNAAASESNAATSASEAAASAATIPDPSGQANKIVAVNSGGTTYELIDLQQIGVGQTWQDMTASRAAAQTYTNNTGKPIKVKVIWEDAAGNGLGDIDFQIDSLIVDEFRNAPNSASVVPLAAVGDIVPPGSSYSASTSTNDTIKRWLELR